MVRPARKGKKSVLCTVYASTTIAYKLSDPASVEFSFPGSTGAGSRPSIPRTCALTKAVNWPTCSAPKKFMRANATPKSIVPRVIYTPSAYQPYDLMRCFSLAVSGALGGGSKGPGEGDVVLRGAYDLKPAEEGAVRRTGCPRDVGSIEGVTGLHEGSNLQSIRGTRCIVCFPSDSKAARRRKAEGAGRWFAANLPDDASYSSQPNSQTAKQGHSHIPISPRRT